MARFQFFSPDRQTTDDRRLTDGQNRLLNPASRMRARGNNTGQTVNNLRCFGNLDASLQIGSYLHDISECNKIHNRMSQTLIRAHWSRYSKLE